jgi:hypothetical protein
VKVNPSTGEIMPKGMKVLVQNVSATQEQAINIVKDAIPKFESVPRASATWGMGCRYNPEASDGRECRSPWRHGRVDPDWKASRDAARW